MVIRKNLLLSQYKRILDIRYEEDCALEAIGNSTNISEAHREMLDRRVRPQYMAKYWQLHSQHLGMDIDR